MKNNRANRIFFLMFAVLVLISVPMLAGFNSFDSEDDQAYQDVIEAVNLRMKIGVVDGEALEQQLKRTNSVTDAGILSATQRIGAQEQIDFPQYYTEKLAENYQSTQEEAWKRLDISSIKVGAGVLQPHLISVEVISPEEKDVKVSYVNWVTRIYSQGDTYTVAVVFSLNTVVTDTLLEDNVWKTVGDKGFAKEFVPEGYNPIKGTFSSFIEALDFAQNINIEEENPF